MFKTQYKKVYNYVQNKSIAELIIGGYTILLAVIVIVSWTSFTYHFINLHF